MPPTIFGKKMKFEQGIKNKLLTHAINFEKIIVQVGNGSPPPHHFSNGPPLSMICTADGSAWNQIKPYKMNYITYTVQTNASHISLKQLHAG